MAYAPTTIRPQLPQYYGERMPDGTTIESPRARTVEADESREASLRLPIQPNDVRLQPGVKPPASPIAPADTFRFGLETQRIRPKRARQSLRGDISNWASIPLTEQTGESHRNPGPTSTEYRGSGAYQMPYAEESSYSDEEKPKPLRMPSRRHSRPPLSYRRVSNATTRYRPSHDQVRGSVDGSRRTDFEGYESDSRDRLHHQQFYESDDEPPYESRATHVGGGHRGPPKPPPATGQVLRLPWTMWMNSNAKNHFVAFIGEFVGTTMFLFFAFSGTQVANIDSSSPTPNTTTSASTGFSPMVTQYVALIFAFSLMVNVWIFFRISGGLFNPAVSFAMLLTKAMTATRFCTIITAQITGSIFASFLVKVIFPTPLNVRTTLSAETSLARGVFIEAVLTAELVFTIFMLAKEKHKATFIAPVGIGLAMFIAELVGVYYTGGSLNPARSFGPCVVTGVFDSEHWIYWVGPALGAILAVCFYNFIKILEYEMANPDQDANEEDIREKERGV